MARSFPDVPFYFIAKFMSKKNYILLNSIFAGIILLIFGYAAFFGMQGGSYPLTCVHRELLGAPCPTCGMSRAFSDIIRFRFHQAILFQPNSISVFSFFFIQLFLRLLFVWMLLKTKIKANTLGNIDVPLSLALFLFTFRKVLYATFYIFYKMMITGTR